MATALAAIAVLAVACGAPRAWSADPDWPCVQRLVPELSAAAVWDGPDFEKYRKTWQSQPAVRDLVAEVAPRRTRMADVEKAVAAFAESLGADKDAALTAAFAGIFSAINDDRSQLIAGIKRYAKNQQILAAKIRDLSSEMAALAAQAVPESDTRRQQLREQWEWDTRIHKDRERSLTALCEQPVLLEQRLFVLTRAIRAAMSR
jgi:hypothetical protein